MSEAITPTDLAKRISFIDAARSLQSYIGNNNPTQLPLLIVYSQDQKRMYIGIVKPGFTPGPIRDNKFAVRGHVFIVFDASELYPDTPMGVIFDDENLTEDPSNEVRYYTTLDTVVMGNTAMAYLGLIDDSSLAPAGPSA